MPAAFSKEWRMNPLAFFLRKNVVGLSQYLAMLLSPRGVSPRRDENNCVIFRGDSHEWLIRVIRWC